ncbi:MAG TPA: winged helix-turn-helix transcriptional regulator [Terriglobales bacterium]|nr:winged helix-turn-helix transcriptional regulator [Terriglobales bacterium]
MLSNEKVRLADWHKGIREIIKQLDETNIKIFSSMWKYGPRNILEVSRRTGIPFTSVYHRVAKLERKSGRVATLAPQIAQLGMIRVVVLATATPGADDKVTAALKLPNLWRSVDRCEGNYTHLSVHYVPIKFLSQFKKYLRRLSELGLVTQCKTILTGEYVPNFPDFGYYNPDTNQWSFTWSRWLAAFKKKPTKTIDDPASYAVKADKKDLLIIKELQKNARRSFADLAPILGISLQGVKYHFDKKLIPSGIVKYYGFDVWPYPEEVSAYHEVLLEFPNKQTMNQFFSLVDDLFFVLGVAKVLHQTALLVRTYTLQTQVASLFAFFSQMARQGSLKNYSSVRQSFISREAQSISYELFEDDVGWTFDLKKNLSALSKLAKMTTVPQKTL